MKSINFLAEKGVDVQASLDLFGEVEKYNDKLGEFLVGIHTKIKQLIVFMQNKDLTNYNTTVRSMKNDAKYFGFHKLAAAAEEHEMKSSAGDLYFVTEHINDLIKETNDAIVLIQEYMNGTDEVAEVVPEKTNQYDGDTILVVDDSNIVRNFVKRIFNEKYNVGTAENGEEAISIIEANKNNNHIKAILLDLNMPKVDGFGVLEHLRQNDLLRKMPVSIITGDSSKETIDKAFTYDIVDMLNKPFTNDSVKMAVEKTLMRSGN